MNEGDLVASGSRREEIGLAAAVLRAAEAELELAKAELARHQHLRDVEVAAVAVLNEKEKANNVADARVTQAGEQLRLLGTSL